MEFQLIQPVRLILALLLNPFVLFICLLRTILEYIAQPHMPMVEVMRIQTVIKDITRNKFAIINSTMKKYWAYLFLVLGGRDHPDSWLFRTFRATDWSPL